MALSSSTERIFRAGLHPLVSSLARGKAAFVHLSMVGVGKFQDDLLSLRAMGLTYTTLLSFVPFLAVTFSVLKAFGVQNQLEPILGRMLAPLGPEGSAITRWVIAFVDNQQVGVLGAVGVAGLFYTVLSLIGKVEDALNSIWRVRHPRSLGRQFSDYLSVVLVGPVLIFTALALTASAHSHWVVQRILEFKPLGVVVPLVTRVMPFVLLCAVFTFLYQFVPHTRVRLSSALVGGVVAGLLWQVAGAGFAAFVASSTSYAAVYSSFAVLVLFLIWLNVGWLIVLVGGEIAYFYQYPGVYRTSASRWGQSLPFREQLALVALVEITRRHLGGKPPVDVAQLAETLSVPQSSLEGLIDEFVRRGVLLWAAEPPGVTLGRPPERIPVVEILDTLRGAEFTGPPCEGEDPVLDILQRRDQAVWQALDGVTLSSLSGDR
ncbi:MAG TPA: YhjD/YihY/BrkB family envelope integrity protein [Candidatus Binatia bacterium]|nr:YhjD/YihY/BrkB family envelope integrity protein [Candidatus Binatia bacterium]